MKILKADYNTELFTLFANGPHLIDRFYQSKSASEIYDELSPSKEFFTHGEGQAYVCISDENENLVLGRIYVSIDYLTASNIGMFGYFDLINDRQVAEMLIKAASEWLKSRNRFELHGPINLNIYNGYRVQTKGFTETPFIGEPRSMNYYFTLLENFGFTKITSWSSWDFSILWYPIFWVVVEIKIIKNKLLNKNKQYKIIPFDKNNIENEFEKLYPLIMENFKDNYLFTNVSLNEYKSYFLGLSQILDSSSSIIVDTLRDEIIGFGFTYPNLIDPKKQKTLVLHTMCIAEKARKTGLVYLLNQYTNKKVMTRYRFFIGALAKEGRTVYDKLGSPSRNYAVYKINL
jgi:hypothetical protein